MKFLNYIISLQIVSLIAISCNNSNNKKTESVLVEEVKQSTQSTETVDSINKSYTLQSIDKANTQDTTIKWNQKKVKEIGELNEQNDTIIDMERKPNGNSSQLVFRVSSTPGTYKEPSKEWKEYSDKIIQGYKDQGRISDDLAKVNRIAVVKNNDTFIVKTYLTEVHYFYNEAINDVERAIRIIGNDTVSSVDIFLMFKEEKDFPKGEVTLTKIESKKNRWILPGDEFVYDNKEFLKFTYSGILTVPFQFKGLGTIEPTYINVSLVVTDSCGNQQEIFKLPHTFFERLHRVFLCDINGDSRKDIILDIENELGELRYLYISRLENEVVKYEYIGKMELWRDDP